MTRVTPLRSRAAIVLAMAAAAWVAPAALAQTAPTTSSNGPTTDSSDALIFGQRPQSDLPTFYFGPVHGELSLESIYTHNSTSSPAGDTDESDLLFQETLTLFTNGYIVHPNIVELDLSVTGGLIQERFESDDESGSSNGTVYGWDVSAIFMRNQPANITLYSRRTHTTQDIPFGPTQETTSTETGARLSYATAETTAQLNAYHQVDEQSALTLNDTGYTQTRDVVNGYGTWRPASNQYLTWNFGLERSQFEFDGHTNEQDTQTASGSHVVNFGEGNRHTLSSSLSYTSMSGFFDQQDLRWVEDLHLWHTKDLESNYVYSYEQQSSGGNTTAQQVAAADLRHQLYNSLTSIGRVSWQDVSSDETSFQTYRASITENYQKKVPYGTLHANLTLGWEQQSIDGSDPIVVTNQSAQFVGIDPITISRPNAVPSTVILRDATTGRVYERGTDYTVSSNPLGLVIDRTIGGNILPGEPLLINYVYDPLNANEITTNSLSLGSRYEIKQGPLTGLTPYARFYGQNQQVSGGNAVNNDVRDYVLGMTYQLSDLTLMVQREWYDSTLFPFDLWRAEARWNRRVADDTLFTATATYTSTDYHEPASQTDAYSINASLTHRFTQYLSGTIYAAYTQAESDPGGSTTGLEQGLQVDWRYRNTRVYARLRNSTLDANDSDRQFQFFQVGLSRSF